MKVRVFFVLSLIFAILALSAELWALGIATRSLRMRARAIGAPPAEKAQRLAEAREHSRQFPFFYRTGWAFAAGGVAFVIVWSRRREPVSHTIPIGLLVGYLLLQLLLI